MAPWTWICQSMSIGNAMVEGIRKLSHLHNRISYTYERASLYWMAPGGLFGYVDVVNSVGYPIPFWDKLVKRSLHQWQLWFGITGFSDAIFFVIVLWIEMDFTTIFCAHFILSCHERFSKHLVSNVKYSLWKGKCPLWKGNTHYEKGNTHYEKRNTHYEKGNTHYEK